MEAIQTSLNSLTFQTSSGKKIQNVTFPGKLQPIVRFPHTSIIHLTVPIIQRDVICPHVQWVWRYGRAWSSWHRQSVVLAVVHWQAAVSLARKRRHRRRRRPVDPPRVKPWRNCCSRPFHYQWRRQGKQGTLHPLNASDKTSARLNCIKFGQLMFRKMTKLVATRSRNLF